MTYDMTRCYARMIRACYCWRHDILFWRYFAVDAAVDDDAAALFTILLIP